MSNGQRDDRQSGIFAGAGRELTAIGFDKIGDFVRVAKFVADTILFSFALTATFQDYAFSGRVPFYRPPGLRQPRTALWPAATLGHACCCHSDGRIRDCCAGHRGAPNCQLPRPDRTRTSTRILHLMVEASWQSFATGAGTPVARFATTCHLFSLNWTP
jgi:hypothetical protein